MKSIILSLSLFFSAFSFAQEWAEVGATWHFNHWSGNYDTFTCVGEQTVGGKLCRQINTTHDWDMWDFHEFTYYSNDSVYYWHEDSSEFRLLYDFGAVQGDSIYYVFDDQFGSNYHPNDQDSILTIVDSTDIININGNNLRRQYVHYSLVNFEASDFNPNNWDSLGQIIEFIGDINFMYNTYLLDEFQSHWHSPKGLRCFEDTIIGFHDFGIVDSCTWWTDVSIGENELKEIKTFPNPVHSHLNVEWDFSQETTYRIFQLTGSEVLNGKLLSDQPINVSELENGTYILYLRTEGSEGRKIFVKY